MFLYINIKKVVVPMFAIAFILTACSANNHTKKDINMTSPKEKPNYNLDFSDIVDGKPVNWSTSTGATGWNPSDTPGYKVSVDTKETYMGKTSISIESSGEEEPNFQAISITLAKNYDGEIITLTGYIKTENVTDGFAGLWLALDPGIAFDNMSYRGITGTTDWKQYEINLTMNPTATKAIRLGGILSGKGKMWLADMAISIDGKDISEAIEREPFPAELDKEFDSGSGITFPSLTESLIANLELLGRVWGFLKYHHPEVAKGNLNWDYELFRILPQYMQTTNTNERDRLLLDWIGKYGEGSPNPDVQKTPEDAYIKPDHTWIEKSGMNAELKAKIHYIYANRHQGDHYYIKLVKEVNNPAFQNESPYADMTLPDAGFRLLSLYKYWNMIYYFFPSTYLTDKNWNDVLKEYIPLFISVKDRLEYELTAVKIIGEIHDTHANLWRGSGEIHKARGSNFAPFRVQFIENKLTVTDYYNPEYKDEAGLDIGDVITHINGKTVESIVDSLRIYYPASNEPTRLRDIAPDLVRSASKSINIEYISTGQKKQKDLALYNAQLLTLYGWYKITDEKCYKILEQNIGYINMANVKHNDIDEIKENLKNTKGIIVDIRNYPQFVLYELGAFFVSKPTPFAKFLIGNVNNPGEFAFRGDSAELTNSDDMYSSKVVVIINEYSQSTAEFHTMAYRAGDNTTIVGSTTAGADGNVSTIWLPGNMMTYISGIGVFYPDGTQTQRIGIVPDVWAEPTIEGVRQGRDEVLEKAIEVIEQQ